MIPLISPVFPDREAILENLDTCYRSGVWSNFGELYQEAKALVEEHTGGHVVLCSSGASALQAAITSHLKDDDYASIAVPDYTHAGTICAAMQSFWIPKIMRCDRKTRAIDIELFEDECSSGAIQAAVVVNPFGNGIEREVYSRIARQYGVYLIYDYAGAWGDFAIHDEFPTVYSFHATKTMPIGEGGAVVFGTPYEAESARKITNFSTDHRRNITKLNGINAKMSEVTAAVLTAQLHSNYGQILVRMIKRDELQAIYDEVIGDAAYKSTGQRFLSLCTVEIPGIDVHDFEAYAAERGFVAKQYYIPLRSMTAFSSCETVGFGSGYYLDGCIGLPSDCSYDQAHTIASHIREYIRARQLFPS